MGNKARDQYIKVRLPIHILEFPGCKCETVWVLVDQATLNASFNFEEGIFNGTLDSDPFFFDGLAPGDEIAFRFVYEQLPEAIV